MRNRYKRRCIHCTNLAIYSIQTHFTNQGVPHTLKTAQVHTRPIWCEECFQNWNGVSEVCTDMEHCKQRIVEIANNPEEFRKKILLFKNSRAEKYIKELQNAENDNYAGS